MSTAVADPLRWGIVGTGRISNSRVPDLQTITEAHFSAVWGRTVSRAREFAVRHRTLFATNDWKQLIARDDVDALYIPTHIATHFQLALDALEAGKHVLIEKPIAMTASEAALIFDEADAASKFVMETMWMRFNPMHTEIQRRIDNGELGEPRSRAPYETVFSLPP